MDSGAASSIPVCVDLTDDPFGLERDNVLLLNTNDETASGMVHVCLLLITTGMG